MKKDAPTEKKELTAVEKQRWVCTVFIVQQLFRGCWDDRNPYNDLKSAKDKERATEGQTGRPIRVIKRTEEEC